MAVIKVSALSCLVLALSGCSSSVFHSLVRAVADLGFALFVVIVADATVFLRALDALGLVATQTFTSFTDIAFSVVSQAVDKGKMKYSGEKK